MNSRNGIPLVWLKGCSSEDERNKVERLVRGSGKIFDRLRAVLEDELLTIEAHERRLDDFEDTNWAYKQAFRNGQKNKIRYILELIKEY